MPEGRKHKFIVGLLKEGMPDWENYHSKKVYDGNKDPVLIPHKRRTLPYQPDLYADHIGSAGRGRDVYEILDSESISKRAR